MQDIAPADLKSVLHSKRANIYFLEHCRVLVKGGRVEYVTDQGKQSLYWNIPIANTTSVLLGTGTSITQSAMRELAKAGVLVGFCGGGGTPLFSANEVDIEIVWFSPQSEYRPTEYLQAWVSFWFAEGGRVAAAKALQLARLERVREQWLASRALKAAGFSVDANELDAALKRSSANVLACGSVLFGMATNATNVVPKRAPLALLRAINPDQVDQLRGCGNQRHTNLELEDREGDELLFNAKRHKSLPGPRPDRISTRRYACGWMFGIVEHRCCDPGRQRRVPRDTGSETCGKEPMGIQ